MINEVIVVSQYGIDQFDEVRAYVKDLRKRGVKTVDFYIVFPNQKQLEGFQGALKDTLVGPKDIGFFGQFKKEELKQLKTHAYDLLIDLTRGQSLVGDLLIAQSSAKWKAGPRIQGRDLLLDFMIESKSDDLRNLCHHLDQYLWNFNNLNAA